MMHQGRAELLTCTASVHHDDKYEALLLHGWHCVPHGGWMGSSKYNWRVFAGQQEEGGRAMCRGCRGSIS